MSERSPAPSEASQEHSSLMGRVRQAIGLSHKVDVDELEGDLSPPGGETPTKGESKAISEQKKQPGAYFLSSSSSSSFPLLLPPPSRLFLNIWQMHRTYTRSYHRFLFSTSHLSSFCHRTSHRGTTSHLCPSSHHPRPTPTAIETKRGGCAETVEAPRS